MAIGRAVNIAREVVDQLSRLGISAALPDTRFAKPLDTASTIQQAKSQAKGSNHGRKLPQWRVWQRGWMCWPNLLFQPTARISIDEFVEHGKTNYCSSVSIWALLVVEAILKRGGTA